MRKFIACLLVSTVGAVAVAERRLATAASNPCDEGPLSFCKTVVGIKGPCFFGDGCKDGKLVSKKSSFVKCGNPSIARCRPCFPESKCGLDHFPIDTADVQAAPQCNPSKGCNVCSDCCFDFVPDGAPCAKCNKEKCSGGGGGGGGGGDGGGGGAGGVVSHKLAVAQHKGPFKKKACTPDMPADQECAAGCLNFCYLNKDISNFCFNGNGCDGKTGKLASTGLFGKCAKSHICAPCFPQSRCGCDPSDPKCSATVVKLQHRTVVLQKQCNFFKNYYSKIVGVLHKQGKAKDVKDMGNNCQYYAKIMKKLMARRKKDGGKGSAITELLEIIKENGGARRH